MKAIAQAALALVLVAVAIPFALTQPVAAQGDVIYTAFPDGDAASGKFVNITRGLSSLGEVGTHFEIEVPENLGSFEIRIFDGDNGGTWDPISYYGITGDEVWFTLYADPLQTQDTSHQVAQWGSGSMPDNDWFSAIVTNDPLAQAASGDYFYHLDVTWQTTNFANEQNNFKVQVQGQIFVLGKIYAVAGSSYGFIGYGPGDPLAGDVTTTYDGQWHFNLMALPSPGAELSFWNGDFDRADDTSDPNSPSFPPFYSPVPPTLSQRARPGRPADDAPEGNILLIPPSVFQRITSPDGSWTAIDDNPSGDKEWENFSVALDPADNPDVVVPSLPPGRYEWEIIGVDGRNTLFLHPTFNLYAELPGAIGDYVWLDANGNGVQDDGPDAGIGGATVELWWDSDGDGVADTFLAGTTTLPDGSYLFEHLLMGTYEVRIDATTLPAGLAATYDYDGPDTLHVATVDLGVAQVNYDIDFGYSPPSASIGDLIWRDSDGDGEYDDDAGELPLAGVLVELYDAGGNWVASQMTGADGLYLFADLAPGSYTVVIAGGIPGDYAQTYDYDGFLDGQTTYTLAGGEDFRDADFGYRPAASPGTGTPGYWKNHAEAWPVDGITIGGVDYTVAEAIGVMNDKSGSDKSYDMFRTLVSAKLNVGLGNESSCIEDAIRAADAWMAQHPAGSKVKANSEAWQGIESTYLLLDDYNNGLLCAPSRG